MTTTTKISLSVRSVAFSEGGHIPVKYSCEGEDINPPLEITGGLCGIFPRTSRLMKTVFRV